MGDTLDSREQWSRIESIFHGALECDPADRTEYIRRECGGDEHLRERVESLLQSDNGPAMVDVPLGAPSAQQLLGHYRLLSVLGEGGMGKVYLAHDTRLDRDVAVKVLSSELTSDEDHKRRFLREAKMVSALNHPHIVTVYDAGTHGGVDYLVMEYVVGKPLDRLIPRNGLKVREAVRYGMQIADALACAHKSGIIHRDLKPANVLITEDGRVKVVDFGIARQVRPQAETGTLTEPGMVFGTIAYMSPEQAEGKPLDARSDIFSFGSLLYEMVTGRHAFKRDTAVSTIAALLREEPEPVVSLADDVPPVLAELIERCLRKDSESRFQTMEDVKRALHQVEEQRLAVALPSPVRPPARRKRFGLAAAIAIAVLAVAGAAVWYMKSNRTEAVLDPVPLTTYPGWEHGASFSPDGTQVAFAWCKGPPTAATYALPSQCGIYIKQIGVEPPARLTHAEATEFSPAWSPDGRWIAFLRLLSTDRMVAVLIPQRGGTERVLLDFDLSRYGELPTGPHLTWTPDSKRLVYTTSNERRDRSRAVRWYLSMIEIDTGEKHQLTDPLRNTPFGVQDTAPAVSSDGRLLAFARYDGRYGLYMVRLSENYVPEGEPVRIGTDDTEKNAPAWMPDQSEILFASESGFWVNGKNGIWRTAATGNSRPQRLPFAPTFATEPALSARGNRLAYTAKAMDVNIWRLELKGPERTPGSPAPFIASTKTETQPAVSPDGTRIVFESEQSGHQELWVCDRDGSNPQQLTFLQGPAISGVEWSPDGQEIAFAAGKRGNLVLSVMNSRGGPARQLVVQGAAKWPSWSQDGKWLYYASINPGEIWKVPSTGGTPVQITHSGGDVPHASKDGKFIYYQHGWPKANIWRATTEGKDETQIIAGSHPLGQFGVVATGIYYFAEPDAKNRSELRFYEFATAKTKKILSVDRAIRARMSVTPDGRTIYYAQLDEGGSDLMLVENFR